MSKATLAIVVSILLVLAGTGTAIFLARGYRFDIPNKSLAPTGILVATSDPDGAQVFIDDKLRTATNNTINLAPARYRVKIIKEGFTPWEKQVEIKKEEVYKTNVILFPTTPDLKPLTLTGAALPVLSPDELKIAYWVASASAEKNGIWVADLGRFGGVLPFAAADLRQIYRQSAALSLSQAKLMWSADSKQVLAYFPRPAYSGALSSQNAASVVAAAFLLDADRLNTAPLPVANSNLNALLAQWEDLTRTRLAAQMGKLPLVLGGVLATSAANFTFSPDETKLLYQASASATLPTVLTSYLPGTNPTAEVREIKSGNTYIYDVKEDKNYLIPIFGGGPSNSLGASDYQNLLKTKVAWLPSSRHLLVFSEKEIAAWEYDGTNKAVIYAGPRAKEVAFPTPDSRKIVILTSLNPQGGGGENLYLINLK